MTITPPAPRPTPAPSGYTAWTHLNWLEVIAFLHGLAGHDPVEVTVEPATHGLTVHFNGVRTTLYGQHTLTANSVVAESRDPLFSPDVLETLSRSLSSPDVHARLTDHPEQLALTSLNDVLRWNVLATDQHEPGITLSAPQRQSLMAVQQAAVRNITRSTADLRAAQQRLLTAAAITAGAFVATALIRVPVLQLALMLAAALCALHTVRLYNRKLGGLHQLRTTERNLKAGLEQHGFPT